MKSVVTFSSSPLDDSPSTISYIAIPSPISLILIGNEVTIYYNPGFIAPTPTISLACMILSKTASPHDLWISLSFPFTENKDYRTTQLEKEFKSLKKGSLSIHDYCQKIKQTADNLEDVGHPLSNKQLVLQILHGLPKA